MEAEPGRLLDRGSDGAWVLRAALSVTSAPCAAADVDVASHGDVSVVFHGVLHTDAMSADIEPAPAERILAAYRQHGTSAFAGLRGTYVIVVLDSGRDEVLAVRDHMGSVPLFWADGHEGLLVSSSLRALAAHPDVRSPLNFPALGEWVLLRWLDPTETLYRSVRRVPAGHYLRVTRSGRDLVRYWQPLVESRADWLTETDLARFEDVFSRAVARCLALGPAGIFLSGGLDSVSVAAVAKAESELDGTATPVALSLVFPHESCNEEDVQRRVALELGLPQVIQGLYEAAGDTNLLRETLALSATWPQPLTNYWTPAYRNLIQEAVTHGCALVLTGTGGDEWLGVTPYYASNLLRRGDVAGLWRLWQGYRRSNPVPPTTMAKNMLWKFGARDLLLGAASRTMNRLIPGTLARRRARLIDRSFPAWAVPDADLRRTIRDRMLRARDDHSERDLYHRELAMSLVHPLVALEGEEYHEQGARSHATLRHPFLDPDVVQFLARIPPELLNRGGRSKGPIRDLVTTRLPNLGFDRQKKVVATPFASEYLLDNLPVVWREYGGLRALASHGLVDPGLIASDAARVFEQRDSVAVHRLWYLLTLESWVRHAGT